MKILGEYGRYLMATCIVVIGVIGMAKGGYAVWLGLLAFLGLAAMDLMAGKDITTRGGAGKWFYDGVLYLPLIRLSTVV